METLVKDKKFKALVIGGTGATGRVLYLFSNVFYEF